MAGPGDPAAERALLERRVDAAPEDAGAHLALARFALAAGDAETAVDSFALAHHYDPGSGEIMTGYARALRGAGDAAAAEAMARKAAENARASAAARLELAAALQALERDAESIAEYRTALALAPDNTEILCNLGGALNAAGGHAEAKQLLLRALRADPHLAEAHHNLGMLLRDTGETEAGIAEFRAALALQPSPATHCALALALRDAGGIEAALAEYDSVLARAPGFGEAMVERAHTLLMRGDYAKGWDAYEKRFAASRLVPRDFGLPQWNGEDTAGRAVLVFGEQGLGDEIMFASCIPELLARTGACVIECNGRLQKLFARSFAVPVHGGEKGDDTQWVRQFPRLGWQVPIGSLPRLFRGDAAAFARQPAGYLAADPARVDAWRRRYAALDQGKSSTKKIGIAWRGGIPRTRGGLRSMELAQLAPLFAQAGAQFVSLQHGDAGEEMQRCREELGLNLANWPGTGGDIDELAAMAAALDLVITVDNTTAHVAGALGVPLWMMLPRGAEWRYGNDATRVPWYPQARLFRHDSLQAGWGSVIVNVTAALRDAASGIK
jgi:Tfp pilus assembly protein PilF